ncbi:hypothetical protein EJB05_20082, partial [Eragrostis curvula]
MYSCEQDPHTAARTTLHNTSYLQPCAAARSLQLSANHQPGRVDPVAAAGAQQPRRAKKKHAVRRASRRSSTTVVATDVSNFRAMVQELTGFPPAAIFRPLPRRVHAVSNPFVVAAAGQGISGGDGRGQGSATTNTSAGSSLCPDAPAVQPVMAQLPQWAPHGVFDGLSDIGSPVFDSWSDISIE